MMQDLARFRQRIREKAVDPSAPPVLIVALGDSVTQGFMEERRFDFEAVYHHRLKQLLEARYPQTTFSVVNAGCGGESLPGGARRLDRDVLRHQLDLLGRQGGEDLLPHVQRDDLDGVGIRGDIAIAHGGIVCQLVFEGARA